MISIIFKRHHVLVCIADNAIITCSVRDAAKWKTQSALRQCRFEQTSRHIGLAWIAHPISKTRSSHDQKEQ